jgi:hypothetical protein
MLQSGIRWHACSVSYICWHCSSYAASDRAVVGHCRMSGGSGNEEGSGSRKRRSKPPARVALFRHVRFNRVHVSITYKGTYFSLNNAKVGHICCIKGRHMCDTEDFCCTTEPRRGGSAPDKQQRSGSDCRPGSKPFCVSSPHRWSWTTGCTMGWRGPGGTCSSASSGTSSSRCSSP